MKNIVIMTIVLVLAVGAMGLYGYLLNGVMGYLAAIATIRDQASTAGQREVIRRAQEAFVADTAASQEEVGALVTRDSDIVHVIETIEAAGRREKVLVAIGSVQIEPITSMQHHELVRVTMSARGTFASLGAFTTALETFPIASKLNSVDMETAANNLWFGTYTLSLVKEKAL